MPNWKPINVTYLYDGTFEGLLTIVFDSYITKTLPAAIAEQNHHIGNFIDSTLTVTTDYEKADRIFQGIYKTISYDALYNSHTAFLCNQKGKEMQILKYLYHGFEIGPSINTMLAIDYVFDVNAMRKRTFGECHRLKGLLRFQEIGKNVFYSSIHPDNKIIEPLGQHFVRRLSSQNFIIHDKNRNIAFIYDTKEYKIVDATDVTFPSLSQNELNYQELWKAFFKTISIKERKNARCQMQYMPKKYWQDLIEDPE